MIYSGYLVMAAFPIVIICHAILIYSLYELSCHLLLHHVRIFSEKVLCRRESCPENIV